MDDVNINDININFENKDDNSSCDDDKCPICIENECDLKTKCGHLYCIGCILSILKINKNKQSFQCPLCRKNVINFIYSSSIELSLMGIMGEEEKISKQRQSDIKKYLRKFSLVHIFLNFLNVIFMTNFYYLVGNATFEFQNMYAISILINVFAIILCLCFFGAASG